MLFGKWSGTEVKIDDVEYLIMNESDIFGVLLEAEALSRTTAVPAHAVTGRTLLSIAALAKAR